MNFNDYATAEGRFNIYRVYSDGSRELRQSVKNVVTNSGLQNMLDNIAGSARTWDAFAWGSSGVIAGSLVPKTAATSGLVSQDGFRVLDAHARVSNTMTFTALIPSTEGNSPGSISEFALCGSGVSPVFMAAQSFQFEQKDNTFELQFEYSITLQNV